MLGRGSDDCHRLVYTIPQFLNIDSNEDDLKLRFILYGEIQDTLRIFQITGIGVYKGFDPKHVFRGDSLVLRLNSTNPIDSIDFPSTYEGFTYEPRKKDGPKAKVIDKYSDYFFGFSTPASCYGGGWNYDSRYAKSECRWLFDDQGIYVPFLSAEYENWKKNDHINVFLNERRNITSQSFKVLDIKGETVEFELVTKRNPTYTILLNLEQDLKAFQKFTLLVSNTIVDNVEDHDRYYEYPMNVGDKGSVGFGGKYNNLEE